MARTDETNKSRSLEEKGCITYDGFVTFLEGNAHADTVRSAKTHLSSCCRCALALDAIRSLISNSLDDEEVRLIQRLDETIPIRAVDVMYQHRHRTSGWSVFARICRKLIGLFAGFTRNP